MEFVKRQKVICVDNKDAEKYLDLNKIYTVQRDCDYGVYIDPHETTNFLHRRFKTIIQSIDDVVVGMTLTGGITGKKYKIRGKNHRSNSVSVEDNPCYFELSSFKEYKPKEEVMCKKEYKVKTPFTLLDIYKKRTNCSDWQSEFESLLKEQLYFDAASNLWEDYGDIRETSTFMKPKCLKWLQENDFIEEVKKDVILEVGMKLRVCDRQDVEFTIVNAQTMGFCLLRDDGVIFYDSYKKELLFLEKGSSLSDLNNSRTGYNFKVINE